MQNKTQRLIDANALLEHEVEADRMGAMLVVGKGFILDAPTIDPVGTARWKGNGFGDYRCSHCDEVVSGQPNYCRNCGYQMDGYHDRDEEERKSTPIANFEFDRLKAHLGHKIVIAAYGPTGDPVNMSIECEDCNEVLYSVDKETDY